MGMLECGNHADFFKENVNGCPKGISLGRIFRNFL